MPRKNTLIICKKCGKETLTHPGGKYCSVLCANSDRDTFGSNNPNWKGGISKDFYRYKKLQIERYPERIKAREKLYCAIRSGKIKRGRCEVCGKTNAHAHHTDYSKPFQVRWFCRKHHNELHNGKLRASDGIGRRNGVATLPDS